MNDGPKRKRSWIQLHLSTCVVLSFVAGTLIYFNCKPSKTFTPFDQPSYGWPAVVYDSNFELIDYDEQNFAAGKFSLVIRYRWKWAGVALNAAMTLLLLGVIALYCERRIRRRERARTA